MNVIATVFDTILNKLHDQASAWRSMFRDFCDYNDEGLPVAKYRQSSNNGIYWQPRETTTIKYDNTGRRMTDTLFRYDYNSAEASSYTYDENGNLRGIFVHKKEATHDWEPYTRANYHYDAQGKMDMKTLESYYNMARVWGPRLKAAFMYDGDGRITEIICEPGTHYSIKLHYNAFGEADTIFSYRQNIDSLFFTYKSIIYYNILHQPDSARSFDSEFPDYTALTIFRYKDIPSLSGELMIFPNPAHHEVFIRWNDKFPETPVTIRIHNSIGQLVRYETINEPSAIDKINTSGIASGSYLLKILHTQGREIYSGKLVIY